MTEVFKISPRLWLFLIVYTIILTIVLGTATLFIPMPWASGFNFGPTGFQVMMPAPYVAMFIILIIAQLTKRKYDPKVLALIYIVTMVCTWETVFKGFYCLPAPYFHTRIENQEIHGWALSYLWVPSAEAIRALFYPNPAGFFQYANEWAPVIANYIIWLIIAISFSVGWACVYRRLWVDIELMPFPHAQGWIIGQLAAGQNSKARRYTLMVGVFFGLLFLIPYYVFTAYPGFPDLYGWLTSPYFVGWAVGSFLVHEAYPSLRPIILGPLTIQTCPAHYAFLFLAPLDTLFSMTFVSVVIWWLLPQILYYFGYYSGITTANVWSKADLIRRYDPLKVQAVFVGMAAGCVVFYVFLHYRYFVDTIRSAVSGKAPEGEISYRWAYLLILIGFIGLVAIFSMNNVRPWVATWAVVVIWIQITLTAQARAYSSVAPWLRGRAFFKWIWGETMQPAPYCTAEQLWLNSYMNRWATGLDTFGPHLAPIAGALDAFAVGKMAGLDNNTTLKVVLITAVLSTIIVVPLTIYELYYFGWMALPVCKEWDYMWDGDAGAYNNWPASPPWYPQAISGFVLALVLTFMRMRYAWWPLEPFGFVVGLNEFYLWHLGSLTAPIVWIVKYVLLRIGGRRIYEEYIVPVCIGVITGLTLGILIISGIATFRWFSPSI